MAGFVSGSNCALRSLGGVALGSAAGRTMARGSETVYAVSLSGWLLSDPRHELTESVHHQRACCANGATLLTLENLFSCTATIESISSIVVYDHAFGVANSCLINI